MEAGQVAYTLGRSQKVEEATAVMSSRGLFFSGDDLDRQKESMVGCAKVNALSAFTLEQWSNGIIRQRCSIEV
jgi:hypothetical protein